VTLADNVSCEVLRRGFLIVFTVFVAGISDICLRGTALMD